MAAGKFAQWATNKIKQGWSREKVNKVATLARKKKNMRREEYEQLDERILPHFSHPNVRRVASGISGISAGATGLNVAGSMIATAGAARRCWSS